MSRPSKGARLYQRKRKGRSPVWVILDAGGIEIATGARDRGEAEIALARYISAGRARPGGPATPQDMTVGQALSIYGENHAPHVADPARIGYAIDALDVFWGVLPVAEVKGATCRRYVASRERIYRDGRREPIGLGTVRRELGTLQAALNYCVKEGYLTSAPQVTLPEKPAAKERWLTRTEAAWMLRATRRLRIDGRHLSKFILAGLYTGTRKTAALGLAIDRPALHHGWVDTEQGLLYRAGSRSRRSKKRQPTARLPRQFLAHVRRWKARGCRWVVESYECNRIGDIKKGWANMIQIAERLAAKAERPIDLSGVTPHSLRHTAITWAMQGGAAQWDVSGYFGVSLKTLEEVYGHHHPDHQGSAVRAMERRKQ